MEPLNDKDDSENENDLEESGARDHYVSVGKSKLRNEQPLLDDPRYAGKRTSRKDLYSDDDNNESDEEAVDEEVSGSEEEDEAEDNNDSFDDEEDLLANANSNEEEESDDDDDEEEESGAEDSENEEVAEAEEEGDDEINTELRRIQEEEKQMISQLSKSAQSDVEKGQHVRQQLTLWDNCLENRIRMQKVVDNANKLPQNDDFIDFLAKAEGVEKDLEAAKNDLREVIDDLMDMRVDLFTQNGSIDLSDKEFNSRKRYLDDDDEYIEKLWSDISEINDV